MSVKITQITKALTKVQQIVVMRRELHVCRFYSLMMFFITQVERFTYKRMLFNSM